MNLRPLTKYLLAAVLALLAIEGALLVSQGKNSPTVVVPDSPQPGDPDLTAAFAESSSPDQARIDALHFSAICRLIADKLEWDGKQEWQLIRTGVELDEFRRGCRHIQLNGSTYGETYPTLAEEVGRYFDSHVGVSGGPLTPEQRAEYVSAFRAISRAAGRAGE